MQFYIPYNGSYGGNSLRYRLGLYNNAGWTGWKTLWDDTNDGAGSGLDADLLDGQHGSYYAPSTGSGNYIQNKTFAEDQGQSANFYIWGSGYFGENNTPDRYLRLYSSAAQIIETTNDLYIGTSGTSAIHLQPGRIGGSNGSVHIRNNAGTNWASFDGVNQRLGVGTSSPTTTLQVNGPSAQINNTVWGWNSLLVYPSSTTYYKIATLPSSNSGTYDHIVIEGVFDDNWGSNQKAPFKIYLGNRNGFSYSYDMFGYVRQNARIVAFQESDNSVSVYLYHAASSYTSISYNIINSLQSTIYPNPSSTTTAPTGTLVFDSYTTTPRFIINNAGNVGIGTASPSQKLDVNGTFRCNDIVGQQGLVDQSTTSWPFSAPTWTNVRSVTITKSSESSKILVIAYFSGTTGSASSSAIRISRSSNVIGYSWGGGYSTGGYATGCSFNCLDQPSSGTYTYTLDYASSWSGINNSSLVVYEIKE